MSRDFLGSSKSMEYKKLKCTKISKESEIPERQYAK